jgi:hypothetical protein
MIDIKAGNEIKSRGFRRKWRTEPWARSGFPGTNSAGDLVAVGSEIGYSLRKR